MFETTDEFDDDDVSESFGLSEVDVKRCTLPGADYIPPEMHFKALREYLDEFPE